VDAVRNAEQGAMDPGILFKMIFGGGAFDDIFGELSFATMAKDTMEAMEGLQNGMTEEQLMLKAEKAHLARKDKLVQDLLQKLEPYITGKDRAFDSQKADILEKLEAPGGPALLYHVSYIYIQEAKKNLGRFLGVEGFIAGIEETGHGFKQSFSLISSVVKLQVAQEKLEQQGDQDEALTNEIMGHGLSTIWKLGLMEIEKMVRDVCQTILKIHDKKIKEKKSFCLKRIWRIMSEGSQTCQKKGCGHFCTF